MQPVHKDERIRNAHAHAQRIQQNQRLAAICATAELIERIQQTGVAQASWQP